MDILTCTDISDECVFDDRQGEPAFITVIVPTYRRVELLSQTLDSLAAQTNCNFEVVIVDNDYENMCNLDPVVMAYRGRLPISLFRNACNLGMYGNWDRGLELSRTKWVTILHDDDLLVPSFVNDAIYVMAEIPNVELLLFRTKTFFGSSYPRQGERGSKSTSGVQGFRGSLLTDKIYKLTLLDYFLKNEHTGTLTAVFSKDKALSLKGFKSFVEEFGFVSDYAFFVEYCRAYKATYLFNLQGAYYRFHVNETLKFETIMNFIDGCTKVREQILLEHGISGRIAGVLNSVFTAMQIKASSGINCPEFRARLSAEVLPRHALTQITYGLYQFIARWIYNSWQLTHIFSKRIREVTLNTPR